MGLVGLTFGCSWDRGGAAGGEGSVIVVDGGGSV